MINVIKLCNEIIENIKLQKSWFLPAIEQDNNKIALQEFVHSIICKHIENQPQDFEEIKKMAWKIYSDALSVFKVNHGCTTTYANLFNRSWEEAVVFYNMAKDKE